MESSTIKFIVLLIVGGCSLFAILFKEYFKEKGKNIATKEDVEEITQKVENIKFEISNLHSQKNEFLEKRKLALLEFFELFIEFSETYLRNISFVDTYIDQPEKIRERMDKIINKKSEVEKAIWKLSIYEMEDQKFIEQIKTIYNKQIEHYHLTIDFLQKIENNSLFINRMQVTKELADERKKIKDNYIKERDTLEETTLKLPNLLTNIIRTKYLNLFK